MSNQNDTKTKLEIIQMERVQTQEKIKQLRRELLELEKEEKKSKKCKLEKFIDSIGSDGVKEFILTLFKTHDIPKATEYAAILKQIESNELLLASICEDKEYYGSLAITYCLLESKMKCKDVSSKFDKSRGWASYKAIEVLTLRLKKYIDMNYSAHLVHNQHIRSLTH